MSDGWQVGQRVVLTIADKDHRIIVIRSVLVGGDCSVEYIRGHGQRFNPGGVLTDCWGHTFPKVMIRLATPEDEKRLAVITLRCALTDYAWKSRGRVSDKQVRYICELLGIKP